MTERRQERIGWIGGWLGGFVWVVILAIVFAVQGRMIEAVIGLAIAAVACATIVVAAPWRFPKTQYRLLMVPIYVLFFAAVAWGGWVLGDLRQLGINGWWGLLIVLPILIPLWTVGNQRWADRNAQRPSD